MPHSLTTTLIRRSFTLDEKRTILGRVSAAALIFVAGCASSPTSAQSSTPAPIRPTSAGNFDPNIPTPESIIGHKVGARAVGYDALVRYLNALANSSPLVTLTQTATTHEGRSLYYLTITSEANHARLAQIKEDNAKLADPRKLGGDAEAKRIVDNLPGIAWMAYSIHGDEMSSTDAAIEVAYQLTAGKSERFIKLRDELVINIDPLQNPDGRQRYLNQLQQLNGQIPSADYQAMQHRGLWSAGRGNHYLFDLNRDWLMQVQPETRGRAAAILQWHPHLVVDSHEMGSLDTYLFDPPREPFNVDLSANTLSWRRRFSADQAKAFDSHGWSYYTREWYEEWYPGYTNAWASLQGAVGLLYEQAGVNGASITQAAGDTLTFKSAVHHQIVSSLTNLETLRANRRAFLQDFLAERRQAVSNEVEDDREGQVFLVPPMADRAIHDRFRDLLNRQGIEFAIAAAPFGARDVVDTFGKRLASREFPTGTTVVSTSQPQRRMLRAILGFDPHMTDEYLQLERKDLENHKGSRSYDVTAWNIPMAYGIDAFWAREADSVSPAQITVKKSVRPDSQAAYGYVVDGASSDVYRAIVELLAKDCKIRVATKPFTVDGHAYLPGTLLLRRHENTDSLMLDVLSATDGLTLDVFGVSTALSDKGPDLGGRRFGLLTAPRIAIASQWPVSTGSFGATWHLLDSRLGTQTSPINLQSVGRMDLRRYNVLILPNTFSTSGLGAILNEGTLTKLNNWMKSGGTLIAMGNSAAFLANADRKISKVRLKRNVLETLDEYAHEVQRERDARVVEVDSAEVWGEAEESDSDVETTDVEDEDEDCKEKPTSDKNTKDAKRNDKWQRVFSPIGVFAAADIDTEHWLTFGLGDRMPALVGGSYAFMSKYPVRTPVRLAPAERIRLSGLMWPEARQRWADTAYVTVERIGNGQLILFAGDAMFRGYMEATGRMLCNAVLLGPGLGTSQPVPW